MQSFDLRERKDKGMLLRLSESSHCIETMFSVMLKKYNQVINVIIMFRNTSCILIGSDRSSQPYQ